jgi:sulfite reductase beta subunit-like hemoprotein
MAARLGQELTETAARDHQASPLRVNVSGCSHSCAHHQAADVGLAGVKTRAGRGFEVYASGRLGADPRAGQRIGKVAEAEAGPVVRALLDRYRAERGPDETFACRCCTWRRRSPRRRAAGTCGSTGWSPGRAR